MPRRCLNLHCRVNERCNEIYGQMNKYNQTLIMVMSWYDFGNMIMHIVMHIIIFQIIIIIIIIMIYKKDEKLDEEIYNNYLIWFNKIATAVQFIGNDNNMHRNIQPDTLLIKNDKGILLSDFSKSIGWVSDLMTTVAHVESIERFHRRFFSQRDGYQPDHFISNNYYTAPEVSKYYFDIRTKIQKKRAIASESEYPIYILG
eukprot:GHVR01001464.1.p1 GENE.GHVR01001464.1~~GHVR01001464.1.p1  ORF type:complete len:201 (-),score=19.67 GHVR01001464.1:93-695(-)